MTVKRLILFLLSFPWVICSGQIKNDSYDNLWKKIDSLINKTGLVKTALNEVAAIYTKAKKENNNAQLIKALVYRINLNEQLTDNNNEMFTSLEKEIILSKEPAKSILKSILATSYWNYLQRNRYKFYNRTATTNFIKDDPGTWSLEDLDKKISSLYLTSLSNASLLEQTKLELYDVIIIKGNAHHLRPTLFDLLAHRALDYFKNDERNITNPAYAFEISDTAAFADAGEFVTHQFKTQDSLSEHYLALLLLQKLITMHQKDIKPDALIDVDIERIEFAENNSNADNKEELYKFALAKIINKYPGNTIAAQAIYLLANSYAGKAGTYDPMKDTTNRYTYVKAKYLCEKALLLKDSSEGKSNCATLLKQIIQKEIKTEVEKVNVIGQPFRVLLIYRNVLTAYFRIIKLDAALKQKIGKDNWSGIFWEQLTKIQPVNSFSTDLPETKDYQNHRVEIRVESLPAGEYALITSSNKNFGSKENALALQYFYISNIAYVRKENHYYVLDRRTGIPLSGAYIQIWNKQYDNNKKRDILAKGDHYTTDRTGFFKTNDTSNAFRNFSKLLDISKDSDRLFIDEETYSYSYNRYINDKTKPRAFLFTDRSIYRPGQLLYFKGILVNKDQEGKPSVFSNHSSTVKLYDANNQAVDSLSLTTNEFGSYSGKFILPSDHLNGLFYIKDEGTEDQTRFRVEEYKRPKFSVEIKKPDGTYRLGDSIEVEGSAKSYVGNNIEGASVNYRVFRKMAIPYYGYSYTKIWPPYSSEQMEITHGTTKTNANGKFIIIFRAVPDKNIAFNQNPIFNYEITSDVTDITGETRTGNTNIIVGTKALKIDLDIPANLRTNSLTSIKILTTNMNNIFERSPVSVIIQKLSAYPHQFRERYWDQPDQFVMNQKEYYANFPSDPYSDEMDMTKWPIEKKVYETSGTTSSDSSFILKGVFFQPGWYVIDVSSKDKFNNRIKETRYVQLYDDKIISSMATTCIDINKPIAEPGDKINYRFLTNLDSVYLIHELIKPSGQTTELFVTLKSPLSKDIRITEADRGGILVNTFFVKDNREYTNQQLITIPYSNKQLAIDYTTFRDKTIPGTKEKWKIKIKGYKGEKLTSELLTSMYDASLDQFNPHSWSTPSLFYNSIDQSSWNGEVNFKKNESYENSFGPEYGEVFHKTYDVLYATSPNSPLMIRGVNSGQMGPIVESVDTDKKSNIKKALRGSVSYKNSMGYTENSEKDEYEQSPLVQPRKNLNETAFFFPELYTDSSGNIEFSFTTPEALTTWKLMLMAHTKDLAFGYGERTMITQKQLMVQPNMPRFLREGDCIDLSTKIVNMSDKEISGNVTLQLNDALTGRNIDTLFNNNSSGKAFTIAVGQSIAESFSINIPKQFNDVISWRIVAKSDSLSDGEEAMLPVISNRILVTETFPLPVKGNGIKNFSFDKLLKSGTSTSLQQKGISVEFTSNPAWYAVQALPYLIEGHKENAEQIFNRYYANALASKIIGNSLPFKQIIKKWRNTDTAALVSSLQKNEELKSVLLQETPWALEANAETQQKKNIIQLFDTTRMSSELGSAFNKLKDMQAPSGGFVWFKGGPEDRYMTQYILSGIGRLKKLGALPTSDKQLQFLIQSGLSYADIQIKRDYERLKKSNKKLPAESIDNITAQYFYMRSFYVDMGIPGDVFSAYNYYRNQSKKAWVKQNTYTRGMIALSLSRTGDSWNAQKIIKSLKETSINNEEMGMYWKDMNNGYYWYQAPIETQSLIIEAFSEITKDTLTINDMKTWLLKNKQTNYWKSSRATADACYALLLQSGDWLSNDPSIKVSLGDKKISFGSTEAGTGYFKQYIPSDEVKPSMGNISLKVSSIGSGQIQAPLWGSIYWQYFEDLNKISGATTPLKLEKKLFIEENTERGPVLKPLDNNNTVHTGDKIRVRIEVRSDRTMEYVHMKDMRASCLEPINVLSEYKWQDGLGYYESTKDASTDFFFGVLPKGTYIFEYSLYVMASGAFSNGITTIQCMYAPEFSSHSEGIKLQSENK